MQEVSVFHFLLVFCNNLCTSLAVSHTYVISYWSYEVKYDLSRLLKVLWIFSIFLVWLWLVFVGLVLGSSSAVESDCIEVMIAFLLLLIFFARSI